MVFPQVHELAVLVEYKLADAGIQGDHAAICDCPLRLSMCENFAGAAVRACG